MKSKIKKSITCFLLFVGLLCNSMIVSADDFSVEMEQFYSDATLEDEFVDNEVLIVVYPNFNDTQYEISDFSSVGCIAIKELSQGVEENAFGRIMKLTIEGHEKQNVLDAINILYQRSDIYCAEPNYIEEIETLISDPIYTSNDQWAIDKIFLPLAWEINPGSSAIKVGIIDGGIDATHPELVNRVNSDLSECFTEYFDDPLIDSFGHGTMVAGIIAAQVNNGVGIAGACRNVQIVSLNVAKDTGRFDIEAIIEAIEYADAVGIKILNYSGGGYNNTDASKAREIAIENYSGLFVCSAGNLGTNTDTQLHYPSTNQCSNLIAVGASTEDDEICPGTNFGKHTVDLFAPGKDIVTCYPVNMCENGTHDTRDAIHYSVGYHQASGTSLAAPYVAGVAALMMAENPDLSPEAIKQIINRTATTVYDEDGKNVFGSYCVSGGILNAYAALQACHLHEGDIIEQEDDWHTVGMCEICEASEIEQPHDLIPYASMNDYDHWGICACGYTMYESHQFDMYVGLVTSELIHYVYCECGARESRYHVYVLAEPGETKYRWICRDCGQTSASDIKPKPQDLVAGDAMVPMSASGLYILPDGTTLQILTESGSYVLSNGVIVLSDEDAALADAGLLEPYELVESVAISTNPGHITE